VRDQPAHDGVAHVQGERRTEKRRRVEVGCYEPEPAQIGENRKNGHAYTGRRARAIDPPRTASLYCGDAEGIAILKRLYEMGEAKLGQLAEELLSNPRVADAFAHTLRKAFETKGKVDKNLQTVLGLLNMPSRADVSRILTKLEAIQGSLVNLNLKVDRLLATRPPRRSTSSRKESEHDSDGLDEVDE
jgi:hypothetical protein